MEIIDTLNDVMSCIDSGTEDDLFKLYGFVEVLWHEVAEHPQKDRYTYKGDIYYGVVVEPEESKADEDVIESMLDHPLAYVTEIYANVAAKGQKKRAEMYDMRTYEPYILKGNTECAINIYEILKDYPDKKCTWDFINKIRYGQIVVLVRPGSVRNLQIIK